MHIAQKHFFPPQSEVALSNAIIVKYHMILSRQIMSDLEKILEKNEIKRLRAKFQNTHRITYDFAFVRMKTMHNNLQRRN